MTLSRSEVVAGTEAELRAFAELIAGLSETQWRTPTRCAGWTVADVAAHVVGTVADVSAGRFAELAGPTSPSQRQVAEREGATPVQLAEELDQASQALMALAATLDDAAWDGPAPGGLPGTLGFGAEGIWYDTYVHADDIRDALGLPSVLGPGLRCAVSHLAALLAERDWGPGTLDLDGLEAFDVGPGGPALRAHPLTFVLVATGRAHPIEIGLNEPLNVYPPV